MASQILVNMAVNYMQLSGAPANDMNFAILKKINLVLSSSHFRMRIITLHAFRLFTIYHHFTAAKPCIALTWPISTLLNLGQI